jgi:enediyne biosynthesis protein E3
VSIFLGLRKRILTPSTSNVKLSKRGFYEKTPDSVELLETIGRSFLTGYGNAVGTRTIADARKRLEDVPRRFRGFAYEGAAMGYAILDGSGLGGRNHTSRFLAGAADRHIYMAYVGIGWAYARLPRWRWRRVPLADQLLGWLAVDGYGFHQAYFRTRKYVYERFQDRTGWPLPFAEGYAARVVDQGVGRAMWFVEGTDVGRVARRIETFPEHRRPDLWSGAGLAATYAGGVDEPELRKFRELAGDHRPQVAQACTFAADARVRAGLVTDHTQRATAVFCDMSPSEAAAVAAQARVGLPADGPLPAYEIWRQRTARQFGGEAPNQDPGVSLGRLSRGTKD